MDSQQIVSGDEAASQFSPRNAAFSSPNKDVEQWFPRRHRTSVGCAYRLCCNLRFCSNFALLICVTFLLCGAVLPEAFRAIVKKDIQSSLVLIESNTAGMKGFISDADSEDRVYAKFYVQNVRNPDAVLTRGERPEIEEIGPFVYRMRNERFNISWSEEGEIISFKQWAFFVFMPELSVGRDNDTTVVSANMVFQALAKNVQKYVPYPLRSTTLKLLYPANDWDSLFIRRTVREVLFGYYDQHVSFANVKEQPKELFDPALFELSKEKGTFFKGLVGNITTRAEAAKVTPVISLHTGKYIKDMMQHFHAFNNEDHLTFCPLACPPMRPKPIWGSPEANRIYGSDGSWFDTRLIEKRKNVYFFFPIFQRPINLSVLTPQVPSTPALFADDTDGSTKGKSKLDTVSYSFDPTFFQNASQFPPNADFYQFGKTGLANISRFAQGLPMFFSKPHFLDADPKLLEGVTGLAPPTFQSHGTLLQLHRFTGILSKLRLRFQINLNIQPIHLGRQSTIFNRLPNTQLPLCWMEINENLATSHENLFELLDLAKTILFYLRSAAWIICPVALLMSCWGSELMKQRSNSKELRRRQSSLYEELLRESGDESSFYMQKYVNTSDVWRHSYFQWRILWCAIVTLCVNLVAETVITSGAGSVPTWTPDPEIHESCAVSLVVTTFAVGVVVSYIAYYQASSATAMGDFPSVYWYSLHSRNAKIGCNPLVHFMRFLQRCSNELTIHVLVGLASAFVFSAPPMILMLALNLNEYPWYSFAAVKSLWATLESVTVFYWIWIFAGSNEQTPCFSRLLPLYES